MTAQQSRGRRSDDVSGSLASSMRDFVRTESGSAGLLLIAAVLALAWANSPWSSSYEALWHRTLSIVVDGTGLSMDLHHWVNDGLMAVFFFVIGLEVRREFAVGELTDRRRLVVPLVAGIGGMVVPAALYLLVVQRGAAATGWGIVIGTDTAFLLGMLALVGPAVSTQLRIFLLTLTVIDDIAAVSVIGIAYTEHVSIGPMLVAALALVGIALLARSQVRLAGPYATLAIVAWLATLDSGLHASIAGMLAGLLVPATEPTRAHLDVAAAQLRAFAQSPLPTLQRTTRRQLSRVISVNERLQSALHVPTSYLVVPVFAFANAGVDLRGGVLGDALTSPVTWGVVAGLVLGKLVGISAGAWLTERFGWGRLPQGVGAGHVVGGAALSGIGFTVSLLIADLAFHDPALQRDAIVGVLLSLVLASGIGWLVFRFAARVLGQHDAALPTLLSEPVDPARDHVLGDPAAPLTLVEYLDFECPFSARARATAREVRDQVGPRLRYVTRHLPLARHPHAELAAVAAEAAARQGRYWEMHDELFAHQDHLEFEDLSAYAEGLGLDMDQFLDDLQDAALAAHVRADMTSAEDSGARSTPTFFVNGTRVEGRYDAKTLIAALERSAARPAPAARP
jgi:Na+/H+ antiporter NhaA